MEAGQIFQWGGQGDGGLTRIALTGKNKRLTEVLRKTFTVILIVMGSESEEDSSELSERGVFDELMKTVSPK